MYLDQILELQKELDRFFSPTYRSFETYGKGPYPSVNIFEKQNSDEIVVKAELPGIFKEDISLQLQDDVLVLSGKREIKKQEGDDIRYHRREISFGNFSRQIKLPYRVDSEKVKANFQDGVLTIVLEKHQAVRPRQISVQ